jgi:hypothetical protein
MDWIALHELLGRARGVLEAQPVGPPKQRATMEAYRRYASKGIEGFASWNLPPAQVRRFVSSAVRAVTLERLKVAADELGDALGAGDLALAQHSGQEVSECLDVLRRHPAVRRGKRGSRAKPKAADGMVLP